MSEVLSPIPATDGDNRRSRAWDMVLAIALIGFGICGLLFPPPMVDSPDAITTWLILSITYAMAIGAGLLAPFRRKRQGAVAGLAVFGGLWIWELLKILSNP